MIAGDEGGSNVFLMTTVRSSRFPARDAVRVVGRDRQKYLHRWRRKT